MTSVRPRENRRGQMQQGEERTESSPALSVVLYGLSFLVFLLFLPFSLCYTIQIAKEYERLVIYRLGRRLTKTPVGPGLFFILPCVEQVYVVDIRTGVSNIPKQTVLTRDSVSLTVDAVVYYRMKATSINPRSWANRLVTNTAATQLRDTLGKKTLADFLNSSMSATTKQLLNDVNKSTRRYGAEVERIEITDIKLPPQLQRSLAVEAETTQRTRAKIIAAEGEQKASQALKMAGDIIASSPGAMQLRYLQTMNTVSGKNNHTVVFPFPQDLFNSFFNR